MIRTGPKKAVDDYEAGDYEKQLMEKNKDFWDPFHLVECDAIDLSYTHFIMTLPTPADKYRVLSEMKNFTLVHDHPEWQDRSNAVVMHHIFYFEDLQATGEEVSGYAVKYDFIEDNIIIKKTLGTPDKTHQTPGDTLTLWAGETLFRDSPVSLARKTLANEPITVKPITINPCFDIILKIIAAGWMILVGDVLRDLQRPMNAEEIFTEDVESQLAAWLEDERLGMDHMLRHELENTPFPNRWSRENVDLTDFTLYNPYVVHPEENREDRDGVMHQADRNGFMVPEAEVDDFEWERGHKS